MKELCLLFLLTLSIGWASAQQNPMVRGVYKTFEDFKAGQPKEVNPFYLDSVPRISDKWLGTCSVTPRYVRNNKQVRKIWGFFDGTRSWIHFQNDFFPIEVDGDQLRFDGYGIVDNGGVVASGLLFGLVGAGIYALATNEVAKSKRITYFIDPNNGNIHNAQQLEADLQLVDGKFGGKKLVIYRGTKKEQDKAMLFAVNDSVIEGFVPGSYFEMGFPAGVNQVKICFDKGFGKCETILFTGATQYVECAYLRNAERNDYKFESVSQSEGEHNSVWSFDVQERREKRQRRLSSK